MNLKQALNKLREDIQYWVTLNIRNILKKIDNISADEVDDSFCITDSSGNIIFKVDANGVRTTALTLDDKIVLTKNKHFGPTFPADPVIGQLFFLEAEDLE